MNVEAITIQCAGCGGALDIIEGKGIVKCAYCGLSSVVPRFVTKERQEAYNSAVRYRRAREFDKATKIFENLLADFNDDAELHWSLLLCKYGIVFVDDPRMGATYPTLLRMQNKPFAEDEEFILAMQYARSEEEKNVYINYEEQIRKIQDKYFNIVNSEKPFDIFISYKESDENGERTEDSLIAHQLYNQLTNKGYKVFFSRMTLKEVIGEEFEPYIYSALNSSKLMLLVTTKVEYIQSVWVKNEWSRYLQLMDSDSNKHIALAYKNINPYELPMELRGIQGTNLSIAGADLDILTAADRYVTDKSKDIDDKKVAEKLQRYIIEKLCNEKYYEVEIESNDYLKRYDDPDGKIHLCRLLAGYKAKDIRGLLYSTRDFSRDVDYIYVIEHCKDKEVIDELCDVHIQYIELQKKNEEYLLRSAQVNKILSSALELIKKGKYRTLKSGISMLESIKEETQVEDTLKNARKKFKRVRNRRIRNIIEYVVGFALVLFAVCGFWVNRQKAQLFDRNYLEMISIEATNRCADYLILMVVIPIISSLLLGRYHYSKKMNLISSILLGIVALPISFYYTLLGLGLAFDIPMYVFVGTLW